MKKNVHGGNIYKFAAQKGIAPDAIIDFSANINPLGLSPAGAEAIAHNLDGLIHYPDPNNTELGEITAQRLGVKPENLLFGNGAAELLFAVARLPGFTDVLIPAPGFSEYAEAATAAGLRISSYKLTHRFYEGSHESAFGFTVSFLGSSVFGFRVTVSSSVCVNKSCSEGSSGWV